ncbi:response regulator transcription factor [Candidatus Omnitrophota bacterium]
MGKKILIVDDENRLVQNIKMFLELHGYAVVTALTGNDGIDVAQAERPDLIVLDIIMPGLDGTSTAEILKEKSVTRSTPIIFLSGLLSGQDDGGDGQTTEYRLAKPFEMDKLLAMIKSIIGE